VRCHRLAGEREPCVLDYPTQQRRLLPLVASAYAFHFTGDILRGSIAQLRTAIDRPGKPSFELPWRKAGLPKSSR